MLKKLVTSLTILPLLALAVCSCNGSKEPEEQKPASLEIRESVFFEGNSGSQSIPITLSNPVAGASVKASTDAKWISNLKADDKAVTFDISDNLGDERQAEITVSYGSDIQKTVSVKQVTFAFEDFVIGAQSIGSTSAKISFSPRGYKGNYFFEVFAKSSVDKFLALDTHKPGEMEWGEALYKSDLDYLRNEAGDATLETLLKASPAMYKVTSNGEALTMRYSKLSLGTEYYAICYGMDLDGSRKTPIAMYLFTTRDIPESALTFTGSASKVTQTGATINLIPSDENSSYYWTYISDTEFNMYSLETIQSNMIANLKEYEQQGTPLAAYLDRGASNTDLSGELYMGTKYHIVAWGMDTDGNATSEAVDVFQFSTKNPDITDDCKFQVDILKIEAMDVQIKVTPTNNATRYYTAFISEKRCTGYGDGGMITRILNMENRRLDEGGYGEGVTWATHPDLASGVQEIWGRRDRRWTFDPESSYRIYVFGIDADGLCSTEIKRIDVTTAKPEASNNTFQVTLGENSWRSATFHITPSNKEDYFMPFVVPTKDLETYRYSDGSLMEKEIMDVIRDYYEDEISKYVFKGDKDYESIWTSDEDYSLIVFGYAGGNTTPMYEFKFHSPAIPFNEAGCDLSYTYELFRGSDLYELNPEMWKNSKESCVMKVNIKTTGDPANWYWGIWPPKENFASTGGLDHLVNLVTMPELNGDNIVNKKFGVIYPWWYGCDTAAKPGNGYKFTTDEGETMSYMPWSITAYAEDAEGKYGPLHYDLFIPVPEPKESVTGNREVGYTKAYDFWSAPSTSSAEQVKVFHIRGIHSEEINITK